MAMSNNRVARFLALSLLCVAAVFLNRLSNLLLFHVMALPLFADSVFTAAVVFLAGLVPGLAVILIAWVFWLMTYGIMSPFIIVSIVEVIIIWRLRPGGGSAGPGSRGTSAYAETVSTWGTLMLLYIATAVSASVLGGLVDYLVYARPESYRPGLPPDDVFRPAFYGSEIHQLAVSILSRVPINLVDRAAVVFGGYFIARGIRGLMDRLPFRRVF